MTVLGTTWHKFIKHRYVYRETLPRRFLSSFLSLKKRERKETVKISSKRTRVGGKKRNETSPLREKTVVSFFFFFISHSLDEDCKSCSWTCDDSRVEDFSRRKRANFFPPSENIIFSKK